MSTSEPNGSTSEHDGSSLDQREDSSLLDWLSQRLNLTEIFSLLTSYGFFYAEVDNRKPLKEALAEALERPSPSYASGPRILGLVVVVLLAIEVLTGILLALYYQPTPANAHASLGTILLDVDFGWLVHQIHYWAAQLLIAVLIVRLVRFFVQRVYRAPRELFWVFGALLLLVTLHADLSGRILPWTAHAYWSGVRALEIVSAVPIYGTLAIFVLGVEETVITSLTLIRAYIFHLAFLPAAALALIYLHFSTVRRVGLKATANETYRAGPLLLRRHLVNLTILFVLVFGLLVSLAILAPIAYEPEADPFTTVPGVGPPWYLLAPFAFLELTAPFLPQWVAGLLLFLGFVAFLFLPFLDRSREERPASRVLVAGIAIVVMSLWILLTVYGARVA